MPWLWIFPVLAVGGALAAAWLVGKGKTLSSFVASSLSIVGTIVTPSAAMFPFMMPSYNHPASSLTVWDASSSHLTLGIMLAGVVLFVPIVLVYTSWAYRMMRGKITEAQIEAKDKYLY
jgi:cytochrome d ubiquinol oxidase subunit II